jgi:hypothetical protein
MPTLTAHAAAYTRTGILTSFLSELSDSLPARVDKTYAETRMKLRGGDVRAFLQSLRVLGLIDPFGSITDRARRTRALAQRSEAMQEGLREAYPELLELWDRRGGMPRQAVEDFFKVQYELSASSAGPAAKLFCDLMHEYGSTLSPAETGAALPTTPVRTNREFLPKTEAAPSAASRNSPIAPAAIPDPSQTDLRLAALETLKSVVKINIDSGWDDARIQATLDRFEQMMQRILQLNPDSVATDAPGGG